MWILPSKLKMSFLSAQGLEESKEDLSEQVCRFETSVMWKSKPLSSQTWSQQWKRVFWLKPLFGQTLKPSMRSPFAEWYTASQEAILVNPFLTQVTGKAPRIQDTFSRIYSSLSISSGLFGASLKTSLDTSHWDMTRFTEAYQILVTQLKLEYSQRERSVLHRLEKDYSFLPSEETLFTMGMNNMDNGADEYGDGEVNPDEILKSWVTPTARDYKGANSIEHLTKERVNGNMNHCSQLANQVVQVGLLNHSYPNTSGKDREQLNPAWSILLMGTTLEKILFVPLATQWLSKPQN